MDGAILLVNRDLGEAFRLGRSLDHAGFQTFPARSVEEAAALLRDLHLTVAVLMVDCALPGVQELIATLRRSRRDLRVVCVNKALDHVCSETGILPGGPHACGEPSTKWADSIREMPVCTDYLQ